MFKKIKHWYWLRRVRQAAETLRLLDNVFKNLNVSRQQRRQFFIAVSKDPNEAVKILKQIK
jgi:hypothetical protein